MIELVKKNDGSKYIWVKNFPLFRKFVFDSDIKGLDLTTEGGHLYISGNSLEYLLQYKYKTSVYRGNNEETYRRWGINRAEDITSKPVNMLTAIQELQSRGITV